MTLRVLVVDDEAPARAKLERLLAADPRFVLVGTAGDGAAAVTAIDSLAPDLVILDVEMPGLTGFDVIDALGVERCPAIIFSTAYDHYAVRAFDAAAIDYLLKPYDAARLGRALDRAHARLTAGPSTSGELDTLMRGVQDRPDRLERLLVKSGEAWLPIPIARITRLAAEDKHVRVFTDDGEHRVRQPLRVLEARLDPARFVRVHRSEIVALDAIVRLEPWTHGDALLVLRDGSTVVLSRTYRQAFLARWG